MSESDCFVIETTSPEETERVATALAELLEEGACIALYGDLGAGKTVFARGVVHGLGVSAETAITSPTFVIANEYEGRMRVYHVDAYRLMGEAEIVALGSREMFFDRAVSIVEWADRIERALPTDRLNVTLTVAGTAERRLAFDAGGAVHRGVLGRLAAAVGR
jgi:tRNA threonylcarbamoyladenosine biosynthesis protein TsaE